MTFLNCKGNRKEHTEEALYNLSSDNVYLFIASFCRVLMVSPTQLLNYLRFFQDFGVFVNKQGEHHLTA